MQVKQLSIFLENRAGRLAEVTRTLGQHGINIRALSIADTSEFGILRLIVNQPDRAVQVLREAGFAVSITEVIAVEVPDRPGGLARVLEALREGGHNIEYLYAFVEKASEDALVIMRVEDIPGAVQTLRQAGISVLPAEQVYAL
ncbi:MAG: ACT domain-containing protein [Bacillota bacterium]|nr:ACT domain-containing protein [Bacillota bacterium]